MVVVATGGGWPGLGQHEGGTREERAGAWRCEAMRARGGGGRRGSARRRRRGQRAPQPEGVAPEGSAEAGWVFEAQEAPSWLQPCRGRACRHLRITGGGLHETRLAGGQGTRQGNG